jgi:hypothetical protein
LQNGPRILRIQVLSILDVRVESIIKLETVISEVCGDARKLASFSHVTGL